MEKIFCPKCGTENKTDFKFCVNCGFSLATMFTGQQPIQQRQVEIEETISFEDEAEEQKRIVFKYIGLTVGLLSFLGFFLPWIDLGLDLSKLGINIPASFSGFNIPKFFSLMEQMTETLKSINPDYNGAIPTLEGAKMISWKGAGFLYVLPILSIGISLAYFLEWKILKVFAAILYAIILSMFIYVVSQFGVSLT